MKESESSQYNFTEIQMEHVSYKCLWGIKWNEKITQFSSSRNRNCLQQITKCRVDEEK
jgi:hypothetical protein